MTRARLSARRIAVGLIGTAATALIVHAIAVTSLGDRARLGEHWTLAAAVDPLSARSAAAAAAGQLSEDNLAGAERWALRAVAASPIQAAGPAALGLVRERQGRGAEAAALMSAAGELGWRNRAVQLWLLDAAVRQGEMEVAVLRAEALLRQGIHDKEVTALLRNAAAQPRARRAIAERLAENPLWRVPFLEQLRDLPAADLPAHQALLLDLSASGSPPTANEINAYLRRLVALGRFAQAGEARRRLRVGSNRSSLPDDPEFTRLASSEADSSPFEWRSVPLPGAFVRLDDPPGADASALRVQAEGTVAGRLLEQIVLLPAGRYQLVGSSRDAAPASLESTAWELTCVGGNGRVVLGRPEPAGTANGWTRTRRTVLVPVDCPAQRLELRIAHGSPRPVDLWFGRVELQRKAAAG